MPKPAIEPFTAAFSPAPSRALASAALAGLLCAATSACESTKVDDGTQGASGPTCCAGGAGRTPSDAAVLSTGVADGGSNVPPPHDAAVFCPMDGAAPVVTCTTIVTGMTKEKFTADCDARHGVVEIPPHCGGFNTCMGFSWWA